jgi:hypothetical protein
MIGSIHKYTRSVPDAPQATDGAAAEALAEIVLPDHEGNDVRLGELWQERPVALVWLRHYG